MIEVVALVCSLQAPLRCKDIHLTFVGEIATPYQCFHYGQHELAQWANTHPNWRVHKFRCGQSGRYAKA